MIKGFFQFLLIILLISSVSTAQSQPVEQELVRTGYLLSATSARLNQLRGDIDEIKKKAVVSGELTNAMLCSINLLMENIFWIETTCSYESLLLNALVGVEEKKKNEQYEVHYSRLKKTTLKRMYLNFKGMQSSLTDIDDPKILKLSENVKREMLEALRLVEQVIAALQIRVESTP